MTSIDIYVYSEKPMCLVSKIIKIPGKDSFDDLTREEIGGMIDAFLSGGNDDFDRIALNEFRSADLEDRNLKAIQEDLIRHMYVESAGGEWPTINYNYLRELKARLSRT